ncbi:MAG: CoA-binding protein [Deltaproteobacteria bacterium]|nr:CoA-binding protein [Deltaproteobacteria bacterium]
MIHRPLPEAFFKPRHVAVVGASKKRGFGSGISTMLAGIGYREHLYLVNPREKEIDGLTVYRQLSDIPEDIDLAILIMPASQAPDVVGECVAKRIPAVILESAGFSETGHEGALLEEEVRKRLRGSETRVIGPNCIGIVNPHDRFITSQIDLDSLRPGNIGVIAQSGAFGNILSDWAPVQNLGFSKLVTIGNRLDVDESDLLRYFAHDEKTDVIVLYLEGVKDGRRFFEAARYANARKPILVFKGGSSSVGKSAAASHTGSLAGEDGLYEGIFRQAGVIRAASFQELFDMARVFSREPLMRGPEACIVTCSGSLGVMAADAGSALGLQFPELGPETVDKVRKLAPAWMNVRNPLDVGPSGLFIQATKAVLRDDRIHGLIALPVIPNAVVQEIVESGVDPTTLYGDPEEYRRLAPGKPFVMHTVGGAFWLDMVQKIYGDTLTIVSSAEIAAKSLWSLYRYHAFRG